MEVKVNPKLYIVSHPDWKQSGSTSDSWYHEIGDMYFQVFRFKHLTDGSIWQRLMMYGEGVRLLEEYKTAISKAEMMTDYIYIYYMCDYDRKITRFRPVSKIRLKRLAMETSQGPGL